MTELDRVRCFKQDQLIKSCRRTIAYSSMRQERPFWVDRPFEPREFEAENQPLNFSSLESDLYLQGF